MSGVEGLWHEAAVGYAACMKLAKFRAVPAAPEAVGKIDGDKIVPLDLAAAGLHSLTDLLDQPRIAEVVDRIATGTPLSLTAVTLLPPIDSQEVWAAGVTYLRSQTARMEESEAAADCYARVYRADRPELFFKATRHRVRGPNEALRIRVDATWNVPEPEITLVLNRRLEIVGMTIGNDMSSRDIEGDNPLYLPQAKVYNACAGLGPSITLIEAMPQGEALAVHLEIHRDGAVVFTGDTSAAKMARKFADLVGWLGRDNSFPDGAFLMTGTGIVPDSNFTLRPGDLVRIDIAGIGTLINPIVQG